MKPLVTGREIEELGAILSGVVYGMGRSIAVVEREQQRLRRRQRDAVLRLAAKITQRRKERV